MYTRNKHLYKKGVYLFTATQSTEESLHTPAFPALGGFRRETSRLASCVSEGETMGVVYVKDICYSRIVSALIL